MKILTAAQMRRIDERAGRDFGVPAERLMDNAGRAVAEALLRLFPALASLNPIIVCGKGNNGGDGIAAARHLRAREVTARVVLLSGGATPAGPAAHHLDLARRDGVAVEMIGSETDWSRVAAELPRHGLVVDALLGTGLSGPARGLPARAIQDINAAGCRVFAVDIPSGLSGDASQVPGPAVRAEHTLALACPKIAHVFDPAASFAGRLHVAEIGIPGAAIEAERATLNLIDESDAAAIVPVRESESHKGDYGRLLVIAGSLGKSGAAAMVCLSALRSGAGLVTAATTSSAQPILAGHLFEAMTEALPETAAGALSRTAAPLLRELMRACDVVAIGPGLTAGEETAALVREMVRESSLPVVLDADGINAFAGRAELLDGETRVLIVTPHPGEMARLLSRPGEAPVTAADVQSQRVEIARRFAGDRRCYLVLKGNRTLVADPDGQVWVNPTGNPGMATAGTGDVLTGVLSGLLAQGLSPLESCVLGVYVHGLAGDLATADHGEISLIARDVIDYLPEAFLHLERAAA